jgi:protein phosphatase
VNSNANILQRLAEKSTIANANELINLTKHVTNLLVNENGTVGELHFSGRLVEIPPSGEAIIIGDLHGDLKSLIFILEDSRVLDKLKKRQDVLLIFLGDYGDRGTQSSEVYYVILSLKSHFPKNVILMRGNHEGPKDLVPSPHDLPSQLNLKFGNKGSQVYDTLRQLFSELYTGVVIANTYLLLHGGFPTKATSIKNIAYAHKKHPQTTDLEEILWNDPFTEIKGTISSNRGAGRLFGEDVTEKMLKIFNVKTLIRGHQSAPEGYMISHKGRVLTLFSRKGNPYKNKHGAYLQLDISKTTKVTKKQLIQSIHKF